MSYGSYVNDADEIMIIAIEKECENGTAFAKRIRDEIVRADNNAAKIRALTSQIEGMERLTRVIHRG